MTDLFRKLFGKKEEPVKQIQVDMATTAPLTDQQISSIVAIQNLKSETKQLMAGVGQSVGKQRDHNEDSVLSLTSTMAGSAESIPFGLYIVADGMGGHQFGEVASNAAATRPAAAARGSVPSSTCAARAHQSSASSRFP